jgi:hypothetical protein
VVGAPASSSTAVGQRGGRRGSAERCRLGSHVEDHRDGSLCLWRSLARLERIGDHRLVSICGIRTPGHAAGHIQRLACPTWELHRRQRDSAPDPIAVVKGIVRCLAAILSSVTEALNGPQQRDSPA